VGEDERLESLVPGCAAVIATGEILEKSSWAVLALSFTTSMVALLHRQCPISVTAGTIRGLRARIVEAGEDHEPARASDEMAHPHIPLLSLWAGAEHESFADAEFEPVARLRSISEIAH
jgi:hypothetical protein